MTKEKAEYDAFAGEYKESKALSFRKYSEEYTLFQMIGDIRGKEVYDLACGEGHYTRKLRLAGAQSILGIDISLEMIRLAKREEENNPIGCSYLSKDVAHWKPEKELDLVTGMYFLNYARSVTELNTFVGVIYSALTQGGMFAGLNDNIKVNPNHAPSYKKYGFTKESTDIQKEGDEVRYTFFNSDGTTFQFNNFYLPPEIYEQVFEQAGFSDFEWVGPNLDPEQKKNQFWKEFMEYPPIIGIKAIK